MQNPSPSGTPIQALVIGDGDVAVDVVNQLCKNQRFHITWVGENINEANFAEKDDTCVVKVANLKSKISSMTINELVGEHQPDIIFLCQRGSRAGTGDTLASETLEREMLGSIADSEIGRAPVITVSLEQ